MTIQTKQAVECGRIVTLYRAVTDDLNPRTGTLWHASREKAVAHFQRRGWK